MYSILSIGAIEGGGEGGEKRITIPNLNFLLVRDLNHLFRMNCKWLIKIVLCLTYSGSNINNASRNSHTPNIEERDHQCFFFLLIPSPIFKGCNCILRRK